MRIYFAPMEGLTDSIFRRLHHEYFGGVDKYYMPFLSPTIHRQLTHKEDRELPMADSVPFTAVPQVLTKVADDFLWAARICADRGYREVNLNMGCPSGTVVAKGKGSGMLRDLTALDAFFEKIFSASILPISVKTRLGLESAEEFPAVLDICNRYPIRVLTVHPRVRKQFYSGNVDMEAFRYAYDHSTNPLCYNGDITCQAQIDAIAAEFPKVGSVMIGRGLIASPGMLSSENRERLQAFYDALLEEYLVAFGGGRNAMFRMKEHWGSLIHRFEGSEKLWKQLRKTTDIGEYRRITGEIFTTLPIK